ncbi:hypothetical protein D8674_016901 [Pyrus ussuriensis x Pyrus communis]|uniref:Retrovirus-related Pol polyprotein from transposon TNT 1-94 n=1 Tax=Pyrus ussuriensis x Pyrus communis TaxID=2448454 RepID=A0A5N5HGC1_9ROSA|nr:hypothetical protein D8674_016901 [Pyrus ussuriensis x Pyrus communis]
MWQCEVKDVLAQQDLDLTLEDKLEDMEEAKWNKLNRMACSMIRLCLAKPQKYFLYRFQYKEGTKMITHLDSFNKLIADLLNLDKDVKDEDKTLILLNSLLEAYEHLATTLIYGKDTINFEDVSNALMNHEVRHKAKQV